MEYLVGGIFSAILCAAAYLFYYRFSYKNSQIRLVASQSRTHAMLAPVFLEAYIPKPLNTQSSKDAKSNQLRVLFTDHSAYWIKDNSVYTAKLENGLIIEETTKKLDMMDMNKVELEEMMFIVEKLTEGIDNDYWGPGNS